MLYQCKIATAKFEKKNYTEYSNTKRVFSQLTGSVQCRKAVGQQKVSTGRPKPMSSNSLQLALTTKPQAGIVQQERIRR